MPCKLNGFIQTKKTNYMSKKSKRQKDKGFKQTKGFNFHMIPLGDCLKNTSISILKQRNKRVCVSEFKKPRQK